MFIQSAEKELIIISDEKNMDFANYLETLISKSNEELDIKIKAVIYSKKIYDDNRASIPSTNYRLFIGEKLAKSEYRFYKPKFEKYGMSYGWDGTIGVIYVENRIIHDSDYNDFRRYAKEYSEQLGSTINNENVKKGLLYALAGIIYPYLAIPGAVKAGFSYVKNQKKIREQLYKFVISKFYYDELITFLNVKKQSDDEKNHEESEAKE